MIILSIAITILFGTDTIQLARNLWTNAELRAIAAAQANAVVAREGASADLSDLIDDLSKYSIKIGWVVGVLMIGVDAGSFWSQIQGGVDVWQDVGNGVIKSVVFGLTVTFIAVFQGFEAQATPEGVASATTRTVVVASLAVLGLDFILTAMMFTI